MHAGYVAPYEGVTAPPIDARRLVKLLCATDPDFALIEPQAGPLVWRTRTPGFPGLLQAITAQQISNQAAAAIWARLCFLNGALEPATFLSLSDEALRGAGLSRPKVTHARELAAACIDGRLHFPSLLALPDEGAIAAIISVRGLGRWTAEVYLLFAHARTDVFPAGDIALQASVAHLKGLDARPAERAMRAMAESWRPARAIAARLLWHHWRFVTGRPAMDDFPVA